MRLLVARKARTTLNEARSVEYLGPCQLATLRCPLRPAGPPRCSRCPRPRVPTRLLWWRHYAVTDQPTQRHLLGATVSEQHLVGSRAVGPPEQGTLPRRCVPAGRLS